MFCTKITSRLQHISDKLAKLERTNATLVSGAPLYPVASGTDADTDTDIDTDTDTDTDT